MRVIDCLGMFPILTLLLILNGEVFAGSHGGDCSSATPVALNNSVSGVISPAGDQDFFRIQISGPGTIRTFTTGNTDTFGILYNNACGAIAFDDDRGEGLNFRISGSIAPGIYFVSVRHFSSSGTGTYTLHVEFDSALDDHGDSCATATALNLNSSTAGQVNAQGDQDFFRIQVPTNGRIRLFTSGSTDTFGDLRNSSCTSIASNDDSGAGRNFLIEGSIAAGTYFISIRHFSAFSTGAYTLHVEFEAATGDDHGNDCTSATAISLNSTRGGQIEMAADQDFFRIQIPATGRIRVFTTGSTDTFGHVRNSSCRIIASDDDRGAGRNFLIEGTILAGTYFISVRHFSSTSTGSYTLHVEFEQSVSDDHGNGCSEASEANLNSSIGGQIEAGGDQDFFRIRVPSQGTLTISSSGGTDTFGNLRNSQCIIVAGDDDRGPGLNFLIVQSVGPGTYFVSIRHFSSSGTGNYTLTVQFAAGDSSDDHGDACSSASSLAPNGSAAGRIGSGGDHDFFRIEVPVTGTLTLFTTGSTDTLGTLRNSRCSSLITNDDSGSGLNFRIVRTVAAGTYFVSVRHFSSTAAGSYTLFSEFLPSQSQDDHGNSCTAATIAGLNTSTAGSIESGGDQDFFRLVIPTAGTLTVMTSGSTDTFGNLRDAACLILQSDDDSGPGLNFRINRNVAPGTYFISVRHFSPSGRGGYVLEVDFTPSGAPSSCLIFVHGTRAEDNDKPDNFDWSSDWQAARDYWRSKVTIFDAFLGDETLLTDPEEDFVRAATGAGQRSHFVVRYDGSAAWWAGEAAGLVAREVIRATDGEMDNPAGSSCALTFDQGGEFWVVAHSGGATVMDFILGNSRPDDTNFNFGDAPFDEVAQRINGVLSVGGAHRGSKLADAICQSALAIGCPGILGFETCTAAREWLQTDEDFQVFNFSNEPNRSILLIGGFRGIFFPDFSDDSCLPGADDGILEYATQFACQGDPRQAFDTTNVCDNDSKIAANFFNLDGSREDHDNERNNEDISDRNRRAVPNGVWTCNNVPCDPGTLISGFPNLSSAAFIDLLLDVAESPQETASSPTAASGGSTTKQLLAPTILAELGQNYRQRSRFPSDSGPLAGRMKRLENLQRVIPKVVPASAAAPAMTVYPGRPQFVAADPIIFHAHLDRDFAVAQRSSVRMRLADLEGRILGTASLRDDGRYHDGVADDLIYTAVFKPTQDLEGIFYAEVMASTPAGLKRLARTSFRIDLPDAVPTGAYRERLADGSLELGTEVEVTAAGRFHLEAELYDLNGQAVSWAQKAVRLQPGRHWIPLTFYGLAIRESGLAGPYLLRFVSLSTTTRMPPSRARLVENAYTTQPYSLADFSAEPYNRRELLEAAERIGKGGSR